MATAKKRATTKRSTTTKKKTVAKRATAKPVVRSKVKRVRRAPATSSMQSFRRSRPQQSFFTVQPNIQTVYWLILAIIVVGLAFWVATISTKVQDLYDQIDATNAAANSIVMPAEHK